MSDWPNAMGGLPSSAGRAVYGTQSQLLGASRAQTASVAWPSANLAIFVPVLLGERCIAYKMVVGAGSTAAGNFDVGIYDSGGNRLVSSGATAKGASVEHVADITDTVLGPGLYYLAMAADGTNNYSMVNPSGTSPIPLQKARLYGTLEAASSYTLPSTATMVARTTAPVPLIAVLTRGF